MKAYLDCYPCFFSQALKTARMTTADEKIIHKILTEVSLALPRLNFDASPPEMGREVYRIIREITGVPDPYKEIKENCTQQALALYPDIKKRIKTASDPLEMAVRAAVAGNVIDFGVHADFDLHKDIEAIFTQDFAVDHYSEFIHAVKKAENILYIGDNAGETVFDRLLIEEIKKPTIYVVRENPIINDATIADAEAAGIGEVAQIISSGSSAPGTILSFCSKEFLKIYENAELIISKGQGNYEGLSEENRPIFFLLKAKCPVIARDIGVPQGAILRKKTDN